MVGGCHAEINCTIRSASVVVRNSNTVWLYSCYPFHAIRRPLATEYPPEIAPHHQGIGDQKLGWISIAIAEDLAVA